MFDQVMGLRMLIDDSKYKKGGDVEGGDVCDAINEHLPPQVRMFAVQKVGGYESHEHGWLSFDIKIELLSTLG